MPGVIIESRAFQGEPVFGDALCTLRVGDSLEVTDESPGVQPALLVERVTWRRLRLTVRRTTP